MKDYKDDEHDEGTDRQIDIETPSPCRVRREDSSEERANDRGDSEDGAEEALVEWSLVEGDGDDHEVDDSAEDSCCSYARYAMVSLSLTRDGSELTYCSSDYECSRIWCRTA